MDNDTRTKLALILELIKQSMKQHEEQGKPLDAAYENLLTILSQE